jgi:hypothetical protein
MRKVMIMFLAVLPIAGCGSDEGPSRVSVTGTITHSGKPLEGANVSFVPLDPKAETPGMATTATDGSYALVFGDRSGVAPGNYRVVVSKQMVDEKAVAKLPDEIRQDPLMASLAVEARQKPSARGAKTALKRLEGEFDTAVPPGGGVLDFEVKPAAAAKANAMGR